MARQTQHTVSIDHNTYTLLHDISLRNDRSMRYLIHRAIVEYCNQHAQQTPNPCNIMPTPQPTVVSNTTQDPINTPTPQPITSIPQPTVVSNTTPKPKYIDEDAEGDEPFAEFDWDSYPSKT